MTGDRPQSARPPGRGTRPAGTSGTRARATEDGPGGHDPGHGRDARATDHGPAGRATGHGPEQDPGRDRERGHRREPSERRDTEPVHGRDTGRDTERDTGRDTERRVLLVLLAVTFGIVGAWALLAPASFHADFPLGRAWVALDGPYNEHLVRDVGALQLALGVMAAMAVRRPWLTGVVAVATLVFAVPHLAYHATHLEPFGVGDAVAQVGALAVQVLVPVRLLTIGRAWRPVVDGGVT